MHTYIYVDNLGFIVYFSEDESIVLVKFAIKLRYTTTISKSRYFFRKYENMFLTGKKL